MAATAASPSSTATARREFVGYDLPSCNPPAGKISVIVPAFNEDSCLRSTLDAIAAATETLRSLRDACVETIVVDNNSTDSTAGVALAHGATVIHEPVQGISRARNAGARHSTGYLFVFIDADVTIPATLLTQIHDDMNSEGCVGGGADVDYRPRRVTMRVYLGAWKLLGRLFGRELYRILPVIPAKAEIQTPAPYVSTVINTPACAGRRGTRRLWGNGGLDSRFRGNDGDFPAVG